jgi:hypothetical protein
VCQYRALRGLQTADTHTKVAFALYHRARDPQSWVVPLQNEHGIAMGAEAAAGDNGHAVPFAKVQLGSTAAVLPMGKSVSLVAAN